MISNSHSRLYLYRLHCLLYTGTVPYCKLYLYWCRFYCALYTGTADTHVFALMHISFSIIHKYFRFYCINTYLIVHYTQVLQIALVLMQLFCSLYTGTEIIFLKIHISLSILQIIFVMKHILLSIIHRYCRLNVCTFIQISWSIIHRYIRLYWF